MDYVIALSVVLQALSFYYIGKGRIVYPLILSVYALYVIVEGWLAWRDPAQTMLWLYVGLNLWCIAQAGKGWHASRSV